MTNARPIANEKFAEALRIARLGLGPVFPVHNIVDGECSCGRAACSSAGKHPRTARGLLDATNDESQIATWAKQWPGCNWGLVTGHKIFVVDVDGDAGRDSLRSLEAQYDLLPETIRAITGRGEHLYFVMPFCPVKNSASKVAPGIDVRGENGYVLIAGSDHASGKRYHYAPNGDPADVSLADAPAWLLDLVSSPVVSADGNHPPAPPLEATISEGRRRGSLLSLAGSMRRRGATVEGIAAALRAENAMRCSPPLGEAEIDAIAGDCARRYAPAEPPNGATPDAAGDGRVEIEIKASAPERVTNDAIIAALAKRDELMFQRGGRLVTVLRGSPIARKLKAEDAALVAPILKANLRERIGATCRFSRRVKRKKKSADDWDWIEVEAVQPREAADMILARGEWPSDIRRIAGVCEFPIITQSGRIVTSPGLDPETGVFFAPTADAAKLVIPKSPTRDEAYQAAMRLLELVAEFPFADPASRSAWLCSLLTPICYHAIDGPKPLFLAEANVQGAGKSLLFNLVSAILTGRPAPVANWREGEEMSKTLLTYAIYCVPILLIDNVRGLMSDAAVEAALTAQSLTGRLLGSNSMATASIPYTLFTTTNNAAISVDLLRRIVAVRLQSHEERPESRSGFKIPALIDHARTHRGGLLSDALTLIAGYIAAGRPAQEMRPMGSFEAWSALVRAAVVWAGMADPAENLDALRADADFETGSLAAIINAIEAADHAGRGLTCAEIIAVSHEDFEEAKTLREALESIAGGRDGKVNGRSLGWAFRRLKGRVVGGAFLECVRGGAAGHRWKVTKLSGEAATPTPSGEDGDGAAVELPF